MKNLQTDTKFADVRDGEVLTYTNILEIAVRDPGNKGHLLKELLRRAPILETFAGTKVGADIQLTHDQWSLVNEIFSERKWPVSDGIIEVGRALEVEMKVSDATATTETKAASA